MKTVSDLFSNQKASSQSKKAKNIPPGFLEMLKQSGEIYNPENKDSGNKIEKKDQLKRERRKEKSHFQKVKRLEKEVYNRKQRETQKEIKILQKMLAEEAKRLKQKGKKLKSEITTAYQKPIINPGKSDISYLRNVIRFVKGLIKDVEEASLWLSAWKEKGKKRGAFWTNFTSKKGGAQYLLSSEHSAARSAG